MPPLTRLIDLIDLRKPSKKHPQGPLQRTHPFQLRPFETKADPTENIHGRAFQLRPLTHF